MSDESDDALTPYEELERQRYSTPADPVQAVTAAITAVFDQVKEVMPAIAQVAVVQMREQLIADILRPLAQMVADHQDALARLDAHLREVHAKVIVGQIETADLRDQLLALSHRVAILESARPPDGSPA